MSVINDLLSAWDPLRGKPKALREEFAAWQRRSKIPQIRYVSLLTTVLYCIYAVIELHGATDLQVVRTLIHAGVVGMTMGAVYLLSYRESAERLMLALLMAAPIGAVAINLGLNAHHADFLHYSPEIYLNLMWTFAVSGLSLRLAMATAACSVSLVLTAAWIWPLPSPHDAQLHLLWVLAALSFGLLNALLLEQLHRRLYLKQTHLLFSASTDSLTGLWNRAHSEQLLIDQIHRARRYGTPFSVILLDIDHFKRVNDDHGHGVGDRVLQQFSSLLRDSTRIVDQVGRLGGEEFLIVLPELDLHQAEQAAQNLRQRIASYPFDTVQQKTASLGVSQYRRGESLGDLMQRVDAALYQAKGNGRNRVERL